MTVLIFITNGYKRWLPNGTNSYDTSTNNDERSERTEKLQRRPVQKTYPYYVTLIPYRRFENLEWFLRVELLNRLF